MKARLLSGEDKVLKRAEWSPRQHFPQEVAIVAKNHWNEITITEPGKHRYVSKAMADKDETVPTRFVFVLIFSFFVTKRNFLIFVWCLFIEFFQVADNDA